MDCEEERQYIEELEEMLISVVESNISLREENDVFYEVIIEDCIRQISGADICQN